ncbi:hypothetical protein LBMAG49_21720 [Planctomycetota bacterium]|nr:hypothetical protein LBMAG49_21720 [Planctomycetota bacterium]
MTRLLTAAFSLLALNTTFATCEAQATTALPDNAHNTAPAAVLAAVPAELPTVVPAVKAARKKGTIYKEEVDLLIDAISKHGKGAAFGGDSTFATAQILCAMGHCHRCYHRSDGPIVRPSIDALLRARNNDGSFGKGDEALRSNTTPWVVDALEIMDGDGFADEITTARAWLQQRAVPPSGWQQAVSAVLGLVRSDSFPQQLATKEAAFARTSYAAPDAQDTPLLAYNLLRLVACQEANRLLDKAQGPLPTTFSESQQKAFNFLLAQQKDGIFAMSFGGKKVQDPSITALGLLALQTKPRGLRSQLEQAQIELGLHWLLTRQNEDGSFGEMVLNYTTSVVTGALARWNDPAAKPAIDKAQKFILKCQFLEANSYQSSDRDYGAMGYGGTSSQRADLSNTSFALQALKESGLPQDHEAFVKALVFLQRTQNLTAVNDFSGKVPDPDNQGKLINATSGDDGGACYYPGNSAAGYTVLPDGKSIPRSYGSMTYALLKAYTLCGLKSDDQRVQAAVAWIKANWTLAENPGADPALGEKVKYQGLFYYFMVIAQALDLAAVKEVTATGKDGKPENLDWRKALRAHLESMQQPNGAWQNGKNDRWMEGYDVLCTCYALLALEHCR